MKKAGFLILVLFILGLILYVTFIVAVIKITVGLILLGIAAIILSVIYYKIKGSIDVDKVSTLKG